MKQRLLLTFAMLMTVCTFCRADIVTTVIAERDFTGGFEGNYPYLYAFGTGQQVTVTSNPDGVAINIKSKTGKLWEPIVLVTSEKEVPLKKGGNYKVVVTAKFPCNGKFQVNLGTWDESSPSEVEVESTSGFQEVEFDFTDYEFDFVDGLAHVDLCLGDFLGTTIVKKFQVLEIKEVEAYAVYDINDKALWFYYDDLIGNRTGDGFRVFRDFIHSNDGPAWGEAALPIRMAVFEQSFADARPTSTVGWFSGFTTLTRIDGLQYLNTSEVTSMGWMFSGCTGLKSLNLTNFDTGKVTTMTSMFNGCKNLTTIFVGSKWSTKKVTASSDMFNGCDHLVGGEGTIYDVEKTDKSYARIDGGPGNLGYLSARPSGYAVFTPSDNTLTFYNDGNMNKWENYYELTIGDENPGWWDGDGTSAIIVKKVVFDKTFATAQPVSNYRWFDAFDMLSEVEGWKYLNTSKVTNMESMFSGCRNLTSLNLSTFDTRNVTTMSNMFLSCSGLTTLNLSSFNTPMVEETKQMFLGCSNLRTLDLRNFDTQNVIDMGMMFSFCPSLEKIFSGDWNDDWSTEKLPNTAGMFFGCYKLQGEKGTPCVSTDWVNDYTTYLRVDEGEGAPGYFSRPYDITTGVALPLNDNGEKINDKAREGWYTIDGRKLNGQPNTKGIYIHNGRAVVN